MSSHGLSSTTSVGLVVCNACSFYNVSTKFPTEETAVLTHTQAMTVTKAKITLIRGVSSSTIKPANKDGTLGWFITPDSKV